MVGKTKAPTADEKRRLNTLKEHMPCLPCLLTAKRNRLPTIQHIVSGFTREGHSQTYSSCGWHHLGIIPDGWSRQDISGFLGPSMTMGKRTFCAEYGSEHTLVAVQDLLLVEFATHPWFDYDVPTGVRRRAIEHWTSMK